MEACHSQKTTVPITFSSSLKGILVPLGPSLKKTRRGSLFVKIWRCVLGVSGQSPSLTGLSGPQPFPFETQDKMTLIKLRSKMWYVHVPTPHKECNHYALVKIKLKTETIENTV